MVQNGVIIKMAITVSWSWTLFALGMDPVCIRMLLAF